MQGRRRLRREMEIEEEKRAFGVSLGVLEPRPVGRREVEGIFEVLGGRV